MEKLERKSKGKELTQTPWTLRVDNANMAWLESEAMKTGTARGRIVNNLIEQAREAQAPSTTRWKRLEQRMRDAQVRLMELGKCVGEIIDESKATRDMDEQPDTLNTLMDGKP